MASGGKVGVAVVGAGYWGPNLARAFGWEPNCNLVAICDVSAERLSLAARRHPEARVTRDFRDLLADAAIELLLIATPTSTHFDLARQALEAGKDVLLSKPITRTATEARELIRLAEAKGRILAVDHTFLYTGAVQKIKQIVESGELGELLYFDSVRVNLGLFQPDVNVIYDLAPHDLSILSFLLDRKPRAVQAMGTSHAGNGIENIAYVNLDYDSPFIAHFHFNWLSPVKLRRTLIGGTSKMIVYDDMETSEKVKIYDKGIVVRQGDANALYRIYVDYRTGDMVAPKLVNQEALATEAQHVLSCVIERKAPISDGRMGLEVVQILEATQESLLRRGERVPLAFDGR